jgi:16S rRNA processing protein RimM
MTAGERITVGYVVRAKGVRGEVMVEPLTHSIERFHALSNVTVERPGQPLTELVIEYWQPEAPGVLIKFSGIDNPEQARHAIVKGYITVPREEVAPLPDGQHYVFDLIGCDVEDESGLRLGSLIDVREMPSTDVYVIDTGTKEVMVPAVQHFVVDVSVARRRITVRGVGDLFRS